MSLCYCPRVQGLLANSARLCPTAPLLGSGHQFQNLERPFAMYGTLLRTAPFLRVLKGPERIMGRERREGGGGGNKEMLSLNIKIS